MLRSRGNEFAPRKTCLGMHVGHWDQRSSRAPELKSWGAIQLLTGSVSFDKSTQLLPALLHKGEHYFFSLSPSPYAFKGFFGLIASRKHLTGKLLRLQANLSCPYTSRGCPSRGEGLWGLLERRICFPGSVPRDSTGTGALLCWDRSGKPPATLSVGFCHAACSQMLCFALTLQSCEMVSKESDWGTWGTSPSSGVGVLEPHCCLLGSVPALGIPMLVSHCLSFPRCPMAANPR